MFRPIQVFIKYALNQVPGKYLFTFILIVNTLIINTLSGSLIYFMEWLGHGQDGGGTKTSKVSRREEFYKLLALRFIPRGNEVSRVLIHLLSLIFSRLVSRLWANPIAMIAMSESSVLWCAMPYWWPLILIWRVVTHLTYMLKATPPSRD